MGNKGLMTRNRIINTTMKLIKTKGLADISVREICEASGIAKGTFYVHFEAKEDVAWALLDISFESLLKEFNSFASTEPTLDAIEDFLNFIFDFSIENIELLQLIHHIWFTSYIGKDKLQDRYEDIWTSIIKSFLTNGVNKGLYSIDNIPFMSYFLATSIHGLIDEAINGKSDFDLQVLKLETKRIIKKLIT